MREVDALYMERAGKNSVKLSLGLPGCPPQPSLALLLQKLRW